MKNRDLNTRVKNAFSGVRHGWCGERSFRTQAVMALVAVIFFLWWGLPFFWWALVILAITLVLAAELLNSSIEALADHLHPEQHPAIGKVKDMAAGMVLIMSVGAMIVGILAVWSTF